MGRCTVKISDAVKPGGLFTIYGAGLQRESLDIAIWPDITGTQPVGPPVFAHHPKIVQYDKRGNFVVAQLPVLSLPAVYNVWVKNNKGWSKVYKMNAARTLFICEYEVSQGGVIEVVGRNFDQREFGGLPVTRASLVDSKGKKFELAVQTVNPYHIKASVGNKIPEGSYRIEVSGDLGINWSSPGNGQLLNVVRSGDDPLGLGVAWAADYAWNRRFNVKDFGAVSNDNGDDTYAVQAAADAAEQAGGGLVYFQKVSYRQQYSTGSRGCIAGGRPTVDTALLNRQQQLEFNQ